MNNSPESAAGPRLRLRAEEEFHRQPLVRNLSRSLELATLAPIGPADYPAFDSRDLLVTRHRGAFIKPCPATLNYNCCGLYIFHFGQGCHIGCRYCILEAYLGSRALILFGNVQEGLADLSRILDQPPVERPRRFCTGEFTDSLLLDRRTGLAEEMIKLFAAKDTALLELKTKTDRVDHLLSLPHRGRTVISFSVNAPEICRREESGAAPLTARLSAAARAASAGYAVGLHFDPLILHAGWRSAYQETVDLIGRHLRGANVAWISLGCFRYLPSLKEIMLSRHPETAIYDGEFIKGGDGKMRYPRPLRVRLYRALVRGLREALGPETTIYMCMESPRVWREVFGFNPGTEGLTALLDRRAAVAPKRREESDRISAFRSKA